VKVSPSKPIASVSLDLDNQWTYLKVHGEPNWNEYSTYLPIVVPRVLEFLRDRDLTITFFVVGQDARFEVNHAPLRALADAGHEIGNHSLNHEPWLHLYSEEQVEAELGEAEDLIHQATGQRPIGFRGPGFSVSKTVLRVLKRRGYLYDASTFPTFLGPLARAYYFMTANLSPQEREERKLLFGTFSEGLRPLKPYLWDLEGSDFLEIPVTTMPVVKVPIHASYLLYLAGYSPALMDLYWNLALGMCRLAGVQISLLLHPLDFLGCDDTQALSFFPAMRIPSEKKLDWMNRIVTRLLKSYRVTPMREHAEALLAEGRLHRRTPQFREAPAGFQS
jgi:hypothetical protein